MRAFDAAAVAEQHAAAFRLVDLEAGHRSIFQDRDISAAASLAMTAAVVAEVLIRPVSVYDFRRDKGELLGAMVPAVMEVAAGYARQAVPDGRADDFRSVLQTAANGLAAVMAGVYERKSRQVVARIAGLPEAEREAFARRYDPMPEVLRAFSELGLVFVAAALAVGQRAAGAAARQDNSPAR
jgi:hypothetical protein